MIPVKSDGSASPDVRLPADDRLASKVPTRVRYKVLALACTLAMITYLDRACFGLGRVVDRSRFAPGKHRRPAMGLHRLRLGLRAVRGAQRLAGRRLRPAKGADPHRALVVAVYGADRASVGHVGWAAMCSAAWDSLVVVQFLFGMGEAGAFPNITRALHNWFPYQQRGLAQGAVWMCGRLMGGLTPLVLDRPGRGHRPPGGRPDRGRHRALPAAAALVTGGQCSGSSALSGVVWCVVFALWFRNRPEEKPRGQCRRAGLDPRGRRRPSPAHAGVPWRRILASRNLWLLWLMYACQSYGW